MAMPMFTISSVLMLISAGLPAPSITIISFLSASPLKAFIISGFSVCFILKYSAAVIVPIGSPFTITCEPQSLVGFNKIGFMATSGSIPAASACTTCALPISAPVRVIKELRAIFCDLKGATL